MGFMDIFKVNKIKEENERLQNSLNSLQEKMNELDGETYFSVQEKINVINQQYDSVSARLASAQITLSELDNKIEKNNKQIQSQSKKLRREKELYNAMVHSLNSWEQYEPVNFNDYLSSLDLNEAEDYSPTVILKLHSMDSKSLRSSFRENDKQIDSLLNAYAARYTTKSNRSIYQLMVIALRAELQNILSNLKYEKLDTAIEQVQKVTQKYLAIAGEGNKSIAGTLQKFIGEIEYLFINAVKIEYNYYVKREQAKQEQAAIREQMRQEAEERKALAAEKKRVDAEEKKYNDELSKLKEKVSSANDQELAALQARILELEGSLAEVALKREEIATLANGKAGNVYIVSNLGAFGNDIFKIGMTRRLNPQDRIDELGSASVPFKFDVHSFIFSQDAVSMESELHKRLNSQRVNKVNLRKEFFKVDLDELEKIVYEIDPTAEFIRTMTAEEYRQSLSTDTIYTSDYTEISGEDDE